MHIKWVDYIVNWDQGDTQPNSTEILLTLISSG